jgi:hypothetical protein
MGALRRARARAKYQKVGAVVFLFCGAAGGVASATSLPGCCPDCSDSCENCPAATNYCLVVEGRDSGGVNTYAYCEPLPDNCKTAPSCDCLLAEKITTNDVEPRTSLCTGDTKSGFTINGCTSDRVCPGYVSAQGGECPCGSCCWTSPPF